MIGAWGQCPACGSPMGTTADGVETCPDGSCPYHVGEGVADRIRRCYVSRIAPRLSRGDRRLLAAIRSFPS